MKLAILTIAIAVGAGCASTASAQTPPAPGDSRSGDAKAATLPPVLRAVLAEALANEEREKARPRGLARLAWSSVTFPLPTCLFAQAFCGALNRDGSIAVAPRFDFVDNFHEGRAVVRLGGLYGYVDTAGKVVVEPQYAIAGRYRLGVAEVDIGGKSALIDLDGRLVLEPRFARAGPFTRDVFWVNDGVRNWRGKPGGAIFAESLQPKHGIDGTVFVSAGNWGLIDRAGAWIRVPEITDVEIFDRGNNDVMWAKTVSRWGLIKPDGTWLVEPTFDAVKELSDGLAAVWRDGKIGYVDRTGMLVIPHKFEDTAEDFFEGLPARAKLQRKVGLIDRSGNWVVAPSYDSIYLIYGPRHGPGSDQAFTGFQATRDGKYGVLDRTGKILLDLQFEPLSQTRTSRSGGSWTLAFVHDFFPYICEDGHIIGLIDQKPRVFTRDGRPLIPPHGEIAHPVACDGPYVVKVGNRFGYVDRAFRPLIEAKFESIGQFRHGLAAVKLDGKYGLLRQDGTWALEPNFDAVEPLDSDKALVKVGRRASLIHIASGALAAPRFDDACSLGRGLVGVMLGGRMGAIDREGNWIFRAKYDPWRFGVDLAPVRHEGKWGFIDAAGNAIAPTFDVVNSRFDRGVNWVKKDGEWCPIDRRGNTVSALGCQQAQPGHIKPPRPEHTPACQIVN